MSKTINTLSTKTVTQIKEMTRRVLGGGSSAIATPYQTTPQEIWAEIINFGPTNTNQWFYICKPRLSPLDDASRFPHGQLSAVNLYERKNTALHASGFDIWEGSGIEADPWDVHHVKPIPLGTILPAWGPFAVGDDAHKGFVYVFTLRNLPRRYGSYLDFYE